MKENTSTNVGKLAETHFHIEKRSRSLCLKYHFRKFCTYGLIFEKLQKEMEDDFEQLAEFGVIHNHERTIIHVDVDCFYAQVEMLKNPALKDIPLGIKQKNIVVTSNYVAREYGIKKCMLISEAMKLCKNLVLVSGEDLSDYRRMSTNITGVLQRFSSKVEKLGLDENFIDVTELVAKRIDSGNFRSEVVGHVYCDRTSKCECGCQERLCIGSDIAAEIRNTLKVELDITCCAGIAHNKVLAKLVGETHKPNQQTTLFPGNVLILMESLKHVRAIPGVGYHMSEVLEPQGISSVTDLQNCSMGVLQKLLGEETASRIKNLSFGIDESLVKCTGRPQSIGLEDAFRKIGAVAEVREKLETLLKRLLKLVAEDGRRPMTVKVTARKFDVTTKISQRESRQCTIPVPVFSAGVNQLSSDTIELLVQVIMKLFHKIVDTSNHFHLTLLGVSFTKFQNVDDGKGSILSYFGKNIIGLPKESMNVSVDNVEGSDQSCSSKEVVSFKEEKLPKKRKLEDWFQTPSSVKENKLDMTIVAQLPPDIQKEILSTYDSSDVSVSDSRNTNCHSLSAVHQCPPGVDPSVFSQLPPDIQKELLQTQSVPSAGPKKHAPNSILRYCVPSKNS